jgi:hypothetical protein
VYTIKISGCSKLYLEFIYLRALPGHEHAVVCVEAADSSDELYMHISKMSHLAVYTKHLFSLQTPSTHSNMLIKGA